MRRAATAVLIAMAAWIGAGVPALQASGAGVDLIHNETERLKHPDVPVSQDSTVVRDRVFAIWHHEWSDAERFNLALDLEAYSLEAADGRTLIDLSLTKVHPRYRLTREEWALDVALLALDVRRNAALYAPTPQDNDDTFFLPALVGDLTPRPLLFRGGFWEEYEILTLNANVYAVSLSRVFQLGAGYAFSEDAEMRLDAFETRRFYPERFTLDRTDVVATYRLLDPLDAGDAPVWREASAKLAQQHYPGTGDRFLELTLGSVLRFGGEPVTHFLVPELVQADSYVVYVPGSAPETLLEKTVDKADTVLRLGYEGFLHLGESPYLLAWGGTLESSLIQRVKRTVILHVKLERTY